jgi:predicted MFS family arabinose efflux permease
MIIDESIHLVLHTFQIAASLGIIALFWRNYTEIKSRFNLGLVFFAVSVLGQTIFSISLNIWIHMISDIIMLISLGIFINIIRK